MPRRKWFWEGAVLFGSLVVLAVLGAGAVRWEARARAEEQRALCQREAEKLVEAVWSGLDDVNSAQDLTSGIEAAGAWIPEPGQEDPVYQRYLAGDYQWVLGAGRGHRSPAGLPVQALAALQLLRSETDAARLEELCEVAWSAGGFVVPTVMNEAEQRHVELGLPLPVILKSWQERWETKRSGLKMIGEQGIRLEELMRGRWIESWWMRAGSGEEGLLAVREPAAATAVRAAMDIVSLPEGSAARVTISGRVVGGKAKDFRSLVRAGDEVVVTVGVIDEAAFGRSGRLRGMVLAAATTTAVATGMLGLWLAHRAFRRERDYAERQGDFIAAVSHEMRTPLASMRLLAGNLDREVLTRPEEKKEHTKLILQEMDRLSRMVERVLSFSRRDANGEREAVEPIDPADLLERAWSPLLPLGEQRRLERKIEVDSFDALPEGEPELLLEAVVNLLDNAVKHSPEGGVVRSGAKSSGETWMLWVEDEGEGVPESERGRVFESFYRVGPELRRERPGSGLGLALVRQTAERHGGTVRCAEAKGGGARFEMVLPLRVDPSENGGES